RLSIAASAERSLDRLPPKIATATVEFMLGPLVEAPRRVGHPLQRELTGLWSARRGAYQIVYELNEADLVVNVVRIDHRADVYRPR
ncbi:MAG: type II toxin-antitoxin system RelE/ParE family toxin, partial [Nitrospiraceae bacterium]|nr:type II toxin-antitoxin system RelE/ParE family toxin [Nitrospiraceae bacterium]